MFDRIIQGSSGLVPVGRMENTEAKQTKWKDLGISNDFLFAKIQSITMYQKPIPIQNRMSFTISQKRSAQRVEVKCIKYNSDVQSNLSWA